MSKGFNLCEYASLCCVYLGASPILQVQDAILNVPNPYLRSTTALLHMVIQDVKRVLYYRRQSLRGLELHARSDSKATAPDASIILRHNIVCAIV